MISLFLSLTFALPQAASPCNEARLEKLTRRAAIVLIAQVKEVEPAGATSGWSGVLASMQQVRYEVREVIKGEVPKGEVLVAYYLVKNSLTADKDLPRLSPELFKEQNVHILFLEPDRKRATAGVPRAAAAPYVAFDENCGAITFTPETAVEVRRSILTP
jgi:hypothetical protein